MTIINSILLWGSANPLLFLGLTHLSLTIIAVEIVLVMNFALKKLGKAIKNSLQKRSSLQEVSPHSVVPPVSVDNIEEKDGQE